MFVVISASGEKFIKIGDFDSSCTLEQAESTTKTGELTIYIFLTILLMP